MEPQPVPLRPVAPIVVMVFVALALAAVGDRDLAQTPDSLPSAARLALDAAIRAVDELPDPRVPGYLDLDLRLAWSPAERLEISVVGQNLLHGEHAEFIPSSPSPRRIERGAYGKITWR
jgi:hypothetical protein